MHVFDVPVPVQSAYTAKKMQKQRQKKHHTFLRACWPLRRLHYLPVHDTLVKLHVSGRLALGAHLEGGAGGGGARPHVGHDCGSHEGVDAGHGGQQSDSRSSLHVDIGAAFEKIRQLLHSREEKQTYAKKNTKIQEGTYGSRAAGTAAAEGRRISTSTAV